MPGIHFWTCIPGKDCLILFFLSYFFYFYIEKKINLSILFVLLVFLLRPHIGFIFLLSVIIVEVFLVKGYKKFLLLIISLILLYALLNIEASQHFFLSEKSISENFLIQMLEQLKEYSNKYDTTDTVYQSSNIFLNMFNYILFPIEFIFKNNSLLINISIMGEIISLIMIIHLIITQKKFYEINKKLIYFLTICIFIYLMIIPQSLFNFGLNIRQKWMILPFVIYFSFLIKNLFVRIKKM